jgi:uncharacterized protein YneF (UPF0154 family)
MTEVENVGGDALQILVDGGLFYAVPLFGLSLLLILEGRKRIPMTVGLVAFVISFGIVGSFYTYLGDDPPLNEQMFRLVAAAVVGVLSVSVAEMAMRFLAAGLVFITIMSLISAGSNYGYDLEGDAFLSGILTLIGFFLTFSFRRLVPALMAGLVGSLSLMLSLYLMLDIPLERLDGVSAPDAYLAFVGMAISCVIQLRAMRKEDLDEIDEKDYVY